MNDAEAHDQIDQMVRFIKQEAQEKASEIGVSAEEVSKPIRCRGAGMCARCRSPSASSGLGAASGFAEIRQRCT